MCGIAGMVFLSGSRVRDSEVTKAILRNLLIESMVRGRSATGVAFVSHSKASVVKHNIDARDFIRSDFYAEAEKKFIDGDDKAFGKPNIILAHTRMPTKGSEKNRDNNHPIVSDKIIGVHNGNISNDDDLFKEYIKSSPYLFKRKGEVDTEIIFRMINHFRHTVSMPMYDAIEHTDKLLKGSYACALVDVSTPWLLWLFKDWSPINIIHYPEAGLVIFASSIIFIRRAVSGADLGKEEEIQYPQESCIAINTLSNKITNFDFEVPATRTVGYA